MQTHLQRLELETLVTCYHYLAVQHAASGELRFQRSNQLREIAIERFFVAALDEYVVAVTEDQRAEAVPLGLEDPAFAGREFADSLGEHRQDGRIDSEVHAIVVKISAWPPVFAEAVERRPRTGVARACR